MILRGGRRLEIKIVMTLRMMRARNVHQPRKIDSTQSAVLIIKSPTYHKASWSRTMYSSACQDIGCDDFAINPLYHIAKKKVK